MELNRMRRNAMIGKGKEDISNDRKRKRTKEKRLDRKRNGFDGLEQKRKRTEMVAL